MVKIYIKMRQKISKKRGKTDKTTRSGDPGEGGSLY